MMFGTEFDQQYTHDITDVDDHDVIYTLRTAQQGQVQLNSMADQKANIIIAACLILLSVTQSLLFSENFMGSPFFIPLLLFCIMMMIACVFAFLAVLPNLKRNQLRPSGKLRSPFYFGEFTQLTEDEYVQRMMDELSDNVEAREALLHQIYQLGMVLKRKYNFLRWSYWAVACGFAISVVSLLINLFISYLVV